MTTPKLARVTVNLSLDKTFDYRIPPHLTQKIRIGSMVNLPFGKSRQTGYVISFPKNSPINQLKEIDSIVGDREMLSPPLVRLGEWMADYYCCTIEQAIRSLLPAVVRGRKIKTKKRKVVRLNEKVDPALLLERLEKKAPRQAAAIKYLVKYKECVLSSLVRVTKISYKAIQSLEQQETLTIEEGNEERDPMADIAVLPTQPLSLNAEQQEALDRIKESFDQDRKRAILLFGLTGSGKTEVYLQAIAECFNRGKEAIVLVPEIALTPQTVERFRSRFGDQVSVMHSHLSDGERFDEWTKINEGRVSIVVGARSALFSPFRQLGLIIIDEEHENSYKQDQIPRYQARDVAVMRAHMENATVLLGTATPSLESYHNCTRGKYVLTKLTHRIDKQPLPAVEIVDMCTEATAAGRPQILSRQLINAARETLAAGEQIILFLNRRGFATHMQCLKCGYVAECPDCSLNFTYHRHALQLRCHICGYIKKAPAHCPSCGDADIRYGGLGTEKIESVVKKVFPSTCIVRMDSDTMTRKNAYRDAFTSFRAGEVDILIGTQMIAKGLHFPNVTLVGIIHADQTLNMPDFRAGERTFQLLVQVAGRSGRGKNPGRVLVQTYTPYHEVLLSAINQDFETFYSGEIITRNQLGLPPIKHLLLIVFKGENEEQVEEIAHNFSHVLDTRIAPDTTVSGPMPAAIVKKRKLYHYQILLSAEKITKLSRLIKSLLSQFKRPKGIGITVDVDPYSLL